MNEEAYDPEVEEILSTLDRATARFHELTERMNLLKAAALSSVLQPATDPKEETPAVVGTTAEAAEGKPDARAP